MIIDEYPVYCLRDSPNPFSFCAIPLQEGTGIKYKNRIRYYSVAETLSRHNVILTEWMKIYSSREAICSNGKSLQDSVVGTKSRRW